MRSYEERDFYKHARRTWDMFGEMFEDGVRATSEFIQKVFGPPPAPEYEEDDEYEVFGR